MNTARGSWGSVKRSDKQFVGSFFFAITREPYGTLLVAQLVEALRYKPEGRGFDSRWCHWNFSLIKSFRPRYGPGVNSTSYRNEYQEYFQGWKGVKAVGA